MTYSNVKNTFIKSFLRGFLFVTTSIALMSFGVEGVSATSTFSLTTDYPTKLDVRRTILSASFEVPEGEHLLVWFKYGKNERYTEQTGSIYASGNGYITRSAYNLEEDVRYIYRAVGLNKETGEKVFGNVRHFKIEKKTSEQINTNSSSNSDGGSNTQSGGNSTTKTTTTNNIKPFASTKDVDSFTNNTGILKGIFLTGKIQTTGWFEWGKTSNLNKETTHKKLPLTINLIEFTEKLEGLSSNTTYYYRIMAESNNGISNGKIMSFKTAPGKSLLSGLFGGSKIQESQNVSLGSLNTNSNTGEKTFLTQINQDKKTVSALGWSKVLGKQFFSVDQNGKITASQKAFGIEQKSDLASIFSSGIFSFSGILPETALGWLLWFSIVFVGVTQLRRMSLDKQKKKEDKKQKEKEAQELREYQEEIFVSDKEKKTA